MTSIFAFDISSDRLIGRWRTDIKKQVGGRRFESRNVLIVRSSLSDPLHATGPGDDGLDETRPPAFNVPFTPTADGIANVVRFSIAWMIRTRSEPHALTKPVVQEVERVSELPVAMSVAFIAIWISVYRASWDNPIGAVRYE